MKVTVLFSCSDIVHPCESCFMSHCLLSLPLPSTIAVRAECEPDSRPGLGIGPPEADSEEGGGDSSSRPLSHPTSAAWQTRQVCFFVVFLHLHTLISRLSFILFLLSAPIYLSKVNPYPLLPCFLPHSPHRLYVPIAMTAY